MDVQDSPPPPASLERPAPRLPDPLAPPAAPATLTTPTSPAVGGAPLRHPGVLSPLRARGFSLLFSGQLVSVLGDQVYGLALPWTVLAVTRDPRQVAYVLTASTVPRVLLLLVGGALADRLNPRIVMLAADAGRALVVGALGVTLLAGLPPLWVVALLAGLEGAGTGLFGPGVQAMLPRLVPEQELQAANGLMMVVQNLTLAIGPVLGGVATAAQATFAFLADAGSFVVSALTLFAIRLPARPSTPGPRDADQAMEGLDAQRKGLLREIAVGLGYTFRMPLARSTMMVTVLANLGFTGAIGVALVVLSRALSPSPVTLGLLVAAAGVGGVIGGLSSALLSRLRRRGTVALVLYGLSAVCLGLVPLAAGPASHLPTWISLTSPVPLGAPVRVGAVAGLLGLIGLIIGLGDTMVLTIMQQRIAPEFLSRVFSAQFLAGGIAQPLSLMAAGYLTAVYGSGVTFLAGGASVLLAILIGFTSRELREI